MNQGRYPQLEPRIGNHPLQLISQKYLKKDAHGKDLQYPFVTILSISRCQFAGGELEFLYHYPNLKSLSIGWSVPIESLAGLAYCPHLESLEIKETRLVQAHGIEYCDAMKNLVLLDTGIVDLSVCSGMGLVSLQVAHSRKGENLPDLLYLPENLELLENLRCQSQELRRIPSYPNLQNLICVGGSLEKIGNAPSMINCVCSSNQLKDLSFLEGAPIRELDCSKNQITSIQVLKNSRIERLECNFNRITQLCSLPHCRRLLCRGNSITELCSFPCLENLDCRENKIFTLAGLATGTGTTNLVEIRCSDNCLLSLAGLENCRRLKTVNADNNDIFDITAIKNIITLRTVTIMNNLIKWLPQFEIMKPGEVAPVVSRNFHIRMRADLDFRHNLIKDISHLQCSPDVACCLFENPLKEASLQVLERTMETGFHVII